MTLAQIVSLAAGAMVGLIGAAIFAIILRRIEESYPNDAIKALWGLVALVLGTGGTDYAVFDLILKEGASFYYLAGFAAIFVPLGLYSFFAWIARIWRK